MWKRVLVGALALAAACDAFSFAPAGPLATTSAAARRVGVLPQTRPAGRLATSRTQGLRSVKAMAIPPVLGLGFKSLNKRLVVITGTSSGLGLSTLKALLRRGDSFAVCAVRDTAKMKKIVEEEGLDSSALAVLELDLGSFQSVRDFVFNLKVASVRTSRPLTSSRAVSVCCTPCTVDVDRLARSPEPGGKCVPCSASVQPCDSFHPFLQAFKSNFPVDALVCNAATYQPATPEPRYTVDGIEESLQINHLSHFLLCSLLIDDVKKSSDPRMIVVSTPPSLRDILLQILAQSVTCFSDARFRVAWQRVPSLVLLSVCR
jgi:NAD(P)-dependent dehydrogenase (short-subunit alcohol dehydrogenase family)